MRKILCLVLIYLTTLSQVYAWAWKDLWATHDQQAAVLMESKQFKEAQTMFDDVAWQATAAFRANQYEEAGQAFAKLQTAEGYYNQGNALAHLGQYEKAVNAYNQSLKIHPKDQDTLHNKALVEALIKKNQQPQNEKSQEQKDQDQKNQEQKTQEQKAQEQKSQEQKAQEQKTQEQKAQEQKAQEQKTQEQKAQEQKAQEQKTQEQKAQEAQQEPSKQEQQNNKQLLRMLPDDPGGLLRQKFMRDHMRRMEGDNS